MAAEAVTTRALSSGALTEQVDRIAIYELVQRERSARDLKRWDEMAACYNSDSDVDISWFRGTGADFVAASKKMVTTSLRSFHQMGPTVATIQANRALAETGCAIHLLGKVGDIDVDVVGQARMYSRVERKRDAWLLSGLRVMYISDCMLPLDPTRSPSSIPPGLSGIERRIDSSRICLPRTASLPEQIYPGPTSGNPSKHSGRPRSNGSIHQPLKASESVFSITQPGKDRHAHPTRIHRIA